MLGPRHQIRLDIRKGGVIRIDNSASTVSGRDCGLTLQPDPSASKWKSYLSVYLPSPVVLVPAMSVEVVEVKE